MLVLKTRISVALWLGIVAGLVAVVNCQSKCVRTSRQPGENCKVECTPSSGCVSPSEDCLCDGDCGYSCVPKGLTCSTVSRPILNAIETYTGTGLGDTVTYKCKEGYTMSGTPVRICRGNGQWDGIGPTCLQMCRVPKIPFSVYIKEPKDYNRGYKTGQKITIACKEGYNAIGNPVIICIGGSWTRFPFTCESTHSCKRTFPGAQTKCTQECSPISGCTDATKERCECDGQCGFSCIEIGMSCGDPPDVTNGHRQFNSTLYNATVRYTCDEGFGFNSPNNVKRCTAKKIWEGLKPRCLRHCKKPQTPRNGFISNPRNVYRSGEKVTFECKMGYNKHGISTQMCFLGQWTILPFKCSEGGCGDPGSPSNGRRLGDGFFQKDRVFFSCDVGYKMAGSVSRTCRDNGTWSGVQPTCNVVWCKMLRDPSNGSMSSNNTVFQSKLRFTCEKGFDLIGSKTTTCQADGKWSTPIPACQAITCEKLYPPSNGSMVATSITFNSIIQFRCDEGFEISGPSSLKCEANRSWSGITPSCLPVDCSSLRTPINGTKQGDLTTFPNKIQFKCDVGFDLLGSSTRQCQANRTWSGETTVCKAVDCGRLTTPLNGSRYGDFTTFPNKAQFECHSGFDLLGSSVRECQANRTWSGVETICKAVDCGHLSTPRNGSRYGNITTFPNKVQFLCDDGFNLLGSSVRECQANRTWSGMITVCNAVDCGSLSTPQNGTKQGDLTRFPNEVQFQCDVGFDLLGSSARQCQANRTWSGETTVCKAVDCGRLATPLNGTRNGDFTTFPNKAQFQCHSGFDLLGSSVRECVANRTWSGVETICKAVDCGLLRTPLNGSRHGNATTFPNKVQFLCDDGFNLLGSSVRECQANRTWSGMNTVCKAVDCGILPTPLNGTKQGDLTTFPNEVQFKCDVGFDLLGSSARQCQANRTWSGETTVCEAVDCGRLTTPLNGSRYGDFTTFPNKAQFECHRGFDLLGSFVRECQANRTWSGVETVCKAVDCGLLSTPRNGSRYGNITTFPNKVQFLCDDGFNLLGSSVRECQANRTWSGMITVCKAVDCSSLRTPINGTKQGNLTTFLNEVQFKCDVGFDLLGSSARQCQANRTWSGETTICKAVDCGRLTTPLNGSRYGDFTTFPNKAQFECHSGFDLLGSLVRECQANRTWSGVETVCKAVDCALIPTPHNGSRYGNKTTFPNKVQFLCDDGFNLLGSSVRECQANRTWSGLITVCKAVDCSSLRTPINGTKQGNLTTFPNEIQFKCDEGFDLLGSSARQCQANRTWSGETTVCKAVDCGRLATPLNGTRYGDLTTFPNKAQFQCHGGFDILGSSLRECQANRTWSGIETVCKAVDCGPLSTPRNGSRYGNATTFPNEVQFLCDDGFNLLGSSVRECQANRTWSGMNTVCNAVDCGSLPTPMNGTKQSNLTTFPNEVQFKCDVGFDLLGSSARQCQANRTWSGETTVCEAVDCGELHTPLNGTRYGDCTTFPNKAQFQCNGGFDLLGSSVRKCQANRTWSGIETVCKAVDCGLLSTPRNGSRYSNITTFPNKVQFLCDNGFNLLGSSIRECQANRTWNGEETYCKAVDCGILPTPMNGTKQGNITTFPNKVQSRCDVGFDLLGSSTRECQANGTWSGQSAVCKAVDCGPLQDPRNGSKIGELTVFPNRVKLFCDEGFVLGGSRFRACLPNGIWNGTQTSCSAIDCGELLPPQNGSIDGQENTYPSLVTFTCNEGFDMRGSVYRRCRSNGTWSGRYTTCEAVNCGPLTVPSNGSKEGSATDFPNTVMFHCDEGFTLSGSTVRVCQPNGTWSGLNANCTAVDCGPLAVPLNGSSSGSLNVFPNKIGFACDKGFLVRGSSVRMCQDNGTWSGNETSCDVVNCGDLPVPRNGSSQGSRTTFPNKFSFSCDSGFLLNGSISRYCRPNGNWSGEETTCEAVDCGALPVLSNGSSLGFLTTFPSKVVFNCDEGFHLKGSLLRRCQANGSWSGYSTTCDIVDCGSLLVPLNGSSRGSLTSFRNEITFTCDEGFNLRGSSVRVCRANGTWSGNGTACEAVDCGLLEIPVNGSVHGKLTHYPHKLAFACDEGFTLNGSTSRVCQPNGTWNGIAPSCQAVDCGPLRVPLNGSLHGSLTIFPHEININCDDGYELHGSSVRLCQANGRWSGNTSRCQAVDCGYLPVPTNGSLHGRLTTFPNTLLFTCDEGFRLRGSEIRSCQANKTWTGFNTSCEVVDCGNLSVPVNGSSSGSLTVFPNQINFKCDKGFDLRGSFVRSCEANGTWGGNDTTCTAVDCGILDVPTNGSLVLNQTTYPNSAFLQCDEGFVHKGSSVRVCQSNRTWSGSDTICEVVDCGFPPVPFNGSVHGSLTVFPNEIRFECNKGFELKGAAIRRCEANGTWSGNETECEALDCGLLVTPSNGMVIGSQTTYLSTVEIKCRYGFVLFGSSSRSCQSNATWSGQNTTCEVVDCGPLPTPTRMKADGNLTTYPNKVFLSCDLGLTVNGSAERTCQQNGTWSGAQPHCQVVDCGKLDTPEHGWIYGEETTYPNKVIYSCGIGYQLRGLSERTCSANGSWSGKEPFCEEKRCGPPKLQAINMAYLTQKPKKLYKIGEKVYYSCKAGYVLKGPPARQCNNGKWSRATFSCRRPICLSPHIPDHAYISKQRGKGRYLNKEEVYFGCEGGYILDGLPVITCTDSQWSRIRFSCKAVDCGSLDPPVNGRITDTSGTRYGHNYTFNCDEDSGYVLYGSAVRVCLETELWSGTQPSCKLQYCGDPGRPTHGRQLQSRYTFGKVVTFQCDSGYARRGRQKLKCQINSMWTAAAPTCIDCSSPLGLQSGKLVDDQMSSSSERDPGHSAHHARLHGDSAWCSARSTHTKFLQIDFRQTTEIFAVATQGHPKEHQWLYKYKLKYSFGNQWLTYKESGKEKVFIGNTDRNSVVRNHLKEPPLAKRVRIERHTDPGYFVGSVLCLRAEVYGCEFQSDCITTGTKILAKWYSDGGKTFYFHGFVTEVRPDSVQVSPTGDHITLGNLRELSRSQPYNLLIDIPPTNNALGIESRVVVYSKYIKIPSAGTITNRFHDWYEVQLDGGKKMYQPLQNIRTMKAPPYCEEA